MEDYPFVFYVSVIMHFKISFTNNKLTQVSGIFNIHKKKLT